MGRLFAVGIIWLGCAIAWAVLGTTLVARTEGVDTSVRGEVHSLWGPPATQAAPRMEWRTTMTTASLVAGVEQTVPSEAVHLLEPKSSAVDVHLDLEHRRRGLLWFPTYTVRFDGLYGFENRTGEARAFTFVFPLDSREAGYDGFVVLDERGREVPYAIGGAGATVERTLERGEEARFHVRYRTRGTATWAYVPSGSGEVRDLRVTLHTNFEDVDFTPGSLSPSRHAREGAGWEGEWRFESLISSASIALTLPEKLNPGPLASRITFFAPVSLLFFFFVVAILGLAKGRSMHPMNYFFLGCAFFAFHLLFAYLVDHVELGVAFAASSAVSMFLVVSYARHFVGLRFALREIGLSQLVYLVLFSFTFFWEGMTGLAVTLGAILTLHLMMQHTGKTDWARVLGAKGPSPAPLTPGARSGEAPAVF